MQALRLLVTPLFLHTICIYLFTATAIPKNCNDCTVRPHLPCSIESTHDLASVCGLDSSPQELWPGKPQNLHVSSVRQESMMFLNITWSIPHDASFMRIKGFRVSVVVLSGPDINHKSCLIYNLTLAQWRYPQDLDQLVYFHESCIEVQPETKYNVQVYSLPMPNVQFDQYAAATYTTPSDEIACGDWQVPINVVNDTSLCQVTVYIKSFGPEHCKFTQFSVDLILDHVSNPLVNSSSITKPGNSTSFIGLEAKAYKVMVRPLNYQGQCAPHTFCRSRISKSFRIYGSHGTCIPLVKETTTELPGDQVDPTTTDVLGIVLPCVIGSLIAVALVVVVVVIKRPGSIVTSGLIGKWPNGGTGDKGVNINVQEVDIVSVLILYSKDMNKLQTDYHMEAVRSFAEFLKAQCSCDVALVDWETESIFRHGFMGWLLQKLNNVQVVMIVHSEGGYKRYKADQNQRRFREDVEQTPVKDMFVDAMIYIQANYLNNREKYYHVYFEYTNSEFIIDIFKDSPKYPLMKKIKALFLKLHGRSECEPGVINNSVLHINDRDYTNTEEGKHLAIAIAEASEYIKSNPTWFHEMYGTAEDKHHKCDSTENSISMTKDSGISLDERQLQEIRMQNEARAGAESSIKLDSELPSEMDVHLLPGNAASPEFVDRLKNGNPISNQTSTPYFADGSYENNSLQEKRCREKPALHLDTNKANRFNMHFVPPDDLHGENVRRNPDRTIQTCGHDDLNCSYGSSCDPNHDMGQFEGSISPVSMPISFSTPNDMMPQMDSLFYFNRRENMDFIAPDTLPSTVQNTPTDSRNIDLQTRLQMINADSSEQLNIPGDADTYHWQFSHV